MAAPLSDQFVLPTNKDNGPCTYLCGNSLGALSKKSRALVEEELEVWSKRAVVGHFSHPHQREWVDICDHVTPLLAEVVGAQEKEVACMGTLTANLHLMMDSFYKPTPSRYKILCEARAFPSDQYAFASQVRSHGLDPRNAILEMVPREGEFILRQEDILDTLKREGSSVALVLFSGVQYYTGQWFPMEIITQRAQALGCICGWDLAHAVGNVPLSLHDWGVDFAVWCTYKYLNSGPGGIAGLFMHEKWNERESPRHAGWWGNEPATRFEMRPTFSPILGAQGFQQSNPSVLSVASLLGSLQTFKEAGMMTPIRERSLQLTGTLEKLLKQSKYFIVVTEVYRKKNDADTPGFTIITPEDPESRGAQLSLLFLPEGSGVMEKINDALTSYGIIADERRPDVIRLAPAPLYNTLQDCEVAASCLEKVFEELCN
ncbi:pyridoxal phosphate-dependent transferase [Armillaria luteobubalina]|uniref:Kynureninase n=1 Tax=Armillaria luteobubalina TaxID=153913 RepID=A0AA39UYD9_9AGAR|nr:pyridoxal phosphate-dependent transferase [Armillaria luteobubalina]